MTLLLNSAGLSEHRDLVRKCPFLGDLPIGNEKRFSGESLYCMFWELMGDFLLLLTDEMYQMNTDMLSSSSN